MATTLLNACVIFALQQVLKIVFSNACTITEIEIKATIHCNESFKNQIVGTLPPHIIGIKLILENAVSLNQFNFTGINKIHELEIFAQRLTSIHVSTFTRFVSLKRLTIENTDLRELPGNIFLPLKTLFSLHIQNNWRLDRLNDLAFKGLENIKQLFLTGNGFQYINHKPFMDLPKLEVLILSANKLSSIDRALLSKLHSLRYLNMNQNNINSLQRGFFSGLTNLETLSLTNNRLSVITDYLFEELISLTDLRLWNNSIHFLSKNCFSGLKQLRRIYLNNNKLKEIQNCVFSGLSNLRGLDLSYNELKSVDNNTFFNLSALSILNLDGNYLKMLSGGILQGSKKLERFYARNNQIEYIDVDAFQGLPQLTWISLSNCKISSLPVALLRDQSYHLRILDLSKNKIKVLNTSLFMNLQILQDLDLSHNIGLSLTGIPFQTLPRLHKIYLANIGLTSIPKQSFINSTSVSDLQIQGNQLEDFEGVPFCNMSNLIRLNASGNRFHTIYLIQFSCLNDFNEKCRVSRSCYIDIRNNPIQCTLYFMNVYQMLSQNIHVKADCILNGTRIAASALNQQFFTQNWTAITLNQRVEEYGLKDRYTRQFHFILIYHCLINCQSIIYLDKDDSKMGKRVNIMSIEINTIVDFCYKTSNSSRLSCIRTNFLVDRKNTIEIMQRIYRANTFHLSIFLNGKEIKRIEMQNQSLNRNIGLTIENNRSDNFLIEKLMLYTEDVSLRTANTTQMLNKTC